MLVLIGKSASGKTEAALALVKAYNFSKFITCTTRPKRQNEVDGLDYHFFTEAEFLAKIANDEFIEYQIYNGYYYGSLKSEIANNKVVILEPKGFFAYKEKGISLYSVYLDIDEETRKERILKRGDSPELASKRIENDRVAFDYDLRGNVDLVIDDSKLTPEQIAGIIYQKYEAAL